MHEVIDKLQELSEQVPVPLDLPDFDQLVEVEEEILIPLPAELQEYLLHASDVVYGTLEPVTAADPGSHTYLPEVAAHAWSIGLPRDLIPICQVGDDFYCISQEGEVFFWHDYQLLKDSWESFWQWVEDVWLEQA
ncbi:MAG: SMI1/KNR4 family protein [Shewanella sp.]|nr:SMI1/KNR4 family protein [Shewanella sp.]MCF1431783.1 SMI1/KNR4 family protein [Shewanella sp.]MCF1438747.1 SMI1/KNR4 family protein [Shewanella sp.]MCF1458616.1 SMI1/KNR4 family protein [Shewanella sp.]